MSRKGSNDQIDDVPHLRKEPRPDLTKYPTSQPLNKDLQKLVDNEDSVFEEIYEGTAPDSTDSSLRYAGYAARIRTILLSAHRYVAYTSDVGESLRPIAHPYLVRGAYGVSWAYIAGDVAHEGYKAYWRNQRLLNPGLVAEKTQQRPPNELAGQKGLHNVTDLTNQTLQPVHIPAIEDYRTVMAQRAIFQSLASMGLPAFTIHSIVRYSGRAMKDIKNPRLRTYGPIGLGLVAVPFLPYIFDKPVEEAVEWSFHKAFETFGGKKAVGNSPTTGREDKMTAEARAVAKKEKEL